MKGKRRTVQLPFGRELLEISLPEENLAGVLTPKEVPACPDIQAEIGRVLDFPLGAAPIEMMVRPGEKAVVLVDDYTRATPAAAILPHLLSRLANGGIRREDITILISTGTHRPCLEEEVRQKVGEQVYGAYSIRQHDCQDQENQVFLGVTSRGTPVWVNRLVVEADRLFGIGHIDPSDFAGYAGGRKLIVPGVAALETVDANHSLAVLGFRQHGSVEVPCRLDIDEAGGMVRMDLLINAVLCQDGRIARLYAGTPEQVFREGLVLARQVYEVNAPEVVDLAITSAFPYDVDFYQAIRAIEYADHVVRPGGSILLAAPCPDGIGNEQFYRLLAEPDKTPDDFLRDIMRRKGKVVYNLLGYILARIRLEKRLYGFIPGLTREELTAIGIYPVDHLQAGIEVLLAAYGPRKRAAVLPIGSATVPVRRR